MDSFFTRFRNPLVLLVLLTAQALGLAMQVQQPASALYGNGVGTSSRAERSVSLLRTWSAAITTPLERIAHGSSFHVRRAWSDYVSLRQTKQQNAALEQEIARLRLEQAAFAEDAAQGRRLQALLAFKQQYIASTVAAQVIGTSGSDRSRTVVLDKGADFGFAPNMPVITPDGVVGKLSKVEQHTSQLLLLNDVTSGAGVTLVSTRMRAIVQGAPGGRVVIDDLTQDDRIQPGEHVVTSGGDQVYPRGLPIGIIQSIAPDPQHQPYTLITVQPFSNLSRLEEVLVVTGTSPTLPPAAQQDAQEASVTAAAEDERRAADLLAQKLPGLEKATEPGAANTDGTVNATDPNEASRGGMPGIPNSGLPRAQPPLHPDRYSPGSAPPAADLKPGGPN